MYTFHMRCLKRALDAAASNMLQAQATSKKLLGSEEDRLPEAIAMLVHALDQADQGCSVCMGCIDLFLISHSLDLGALELRFLHLKEILYADLTSMLSSFGHNICTSVI